MKQPTEELKAMVESAPEGATYYLINQYNFTEAYFKLTKDLDVLVKGIDGWEEVDFSIELNGNFEARYLDDIREIIKLREEVETKDKRITKLEAERDNFKETARQYTKLASEGIYYTLRELKQHDLEQQAKGLERVELPDISINESMTLHEYLLSEAAKLREKAQELGR